jgi:glycosyltransferase involved in cell wall biosynthesis
VKPPSAISVPISVSGRANDRAPRPLHVVVVTPLGSGGQGGIDRLMDELRAGFRERNADKVDVVFSTSRGSGSLAFAPLYLAKTIFVLAARKIFRRVDLVHVNLSQGGSAYRKIVVAWVCRGLRIPYVLHLHGSHFHHFWDTAPPRLGRMLDRLFSHAAGTIVLGKFWADYIAGKTPLSKSCTIILPNATRSAVFDKPNDSADVPLRLLFLGEIGQRKGIPQLITALARLREHSGWHAVLAGNGDIDATRQRVSSLNMAERISVPGWVNDRGVRKLLQTADIFILPSFDENLPMSVIEAFAYGVAVIATPVGAVTDIVRDGETGLLVPPGDVDALTAALLRLLADADLRRRLGTNAKTFHTEKLEIGRYVDQLIAIWRSGTSPGK